ESGEGYGEARLYPRRILEQSEIVWLMEGEWDALLAQQLGLPAVTNTGGAGTWKTWWNRYFRDKVVYIVYDSDSAGRSGAEAVAKALSPVAREVRNIVLPTEGDFSDWILREGGSVDELRRIAEETPPEEKTSDPTPSVDLADPEDQDVSLRRLIDSFHIKMTDNGPVYTHSLSVPKYVLTDAVIQWFRSH